MDHVAEADDPKSKAKQIKLTLDPKSLMLLGATTFGTGEDRSTIVNRLIQEHLGEWVITYRGDLPAA